MRVLLTGGSGFLGKRMASYLIKKGVHVVCIGRNPCAVVGVQNIHVSALSPALIESALKENQVAIDALIHLAAAGVHPGDRDSATLFEINTLLPAQLVILGHHFGAKAIVMAGSSAEYKSPIMLHPCAEGEPLETEKLYGTTKAQGGLLALSKGAELGIPVAWMRLFNVYGPHEASHRLLTSLVSRLLKKELVKMSEGNQIRDFVYVDDVCDGLWVTLKALSSGMPSGAYNICTGIGKSVKDFALTVAHYLNADTHLLNFGALPLRPDDAPYLVGDPARFKAASGWVASLSFEEGIKRALGVSS
ncbi:MAG: NAD-dependent epimerase/dehydratase family protein [Gammaproteobacteria bacterium]